MHGQGVMTFNNGEIYKGQWKGGEQHGQGEMTLPNGEQYDGLWENGVLQEQLVRNNEFSGSMAENLLAQRHSRSRQPEDFSNGADTTCSRDGAENLLAELAFSSTLAV
jgi:hypothetical protein